jgi:Amt family ammonium transporter
MATHLAASAGALAWIAIEWIRSGKPTCIGIVTGCVAGLATITPAAGYVHPAAAILIGGLGGAICFFATVFGKQRLIIDDSLDVFAVHGAACSARRCSACLPQLLSAAWDLPSA